MFDSYFDWINGLGLKSALSRFLVGPSRRQIWATWTAIFLSNLKSGLLQYNSYRLLELLESAQHLFGGSIVDLSLIAPKKMKIRTKSYFSIKWI